MRRHNWILAIWSVCAPWYGSFSPDELFLQQEAHLSRHQLYRSSVASKFGRYFGHACPLLCQRRKRALFSLSPGFRLLGFWHLNQNIESAFAFSGLAIFLSHRTCILSASPEQNGGCNAAGSIFRFGGIIAVGLAIWSVCGSPQHSAPRVQVAQELKGISFASIIRGRCQPEGGLRLNY
jgi:hypothetical protein